MTTDKPKLVAAMFSTYSGRLRQFFRSRRANDSDLSDLGQEVFLRLLRTPDDEEILNPEAYLFTIARNLTHEMEQKRSRLPLHVAFDGSFLENTLSGSDDPATLAAAQQRVENFIRALERQPPRAALAFILHRYEGRKISEIAQELGIARITVKKYLASVLRQLRSDSRTQMDVPWT